MFERGGGKRIPTYMAKPVPSHHSTPRRPVWNSPKLRVRTVAMGGMKQRGSKGGREGEELRSVAR